MGISLSQNAEAVLKRRYLKKDSLGRVIETPADLFARVAGSIAQADAVFDDKANLKKTEKQFFKIMSNLWFLPNSPTLMNAGRRLGQLAACFVLPIEDSMDSIFETLKHTAIIHKSGGGTGFSFSKIRPANDIVQSTAGVSSGPVSFMSVYDIATETVKQGGTRRGANMGVLRVDHPDIEAFIQSKTDPDRLNNFNISVAVTDKFMDALEKGLEYELINPRTGDSVASVPAKQIFDMIVDSAWLSGEPGIIFIDRMNAANQTPLLGKIEATNPCGEQPLLPHESCTLGSINLSAMVKGNNLNFERLKQTVRTAVHFLDNVIEINQYPLTVIERMSKHTRKIGLGVMGFADMLIKLEIPYNSDKAVEQAEMVMSCILQESRKASADLAKKRGNFPAYKDSCFNHASTPYMRNATTTTIAPTGTISIIAGVSSGIEPLFALAYTRSVLGKKKIAELHPVFAEKAKKEGFFNPGLAKVLSVTGSIRQVDQIPDNFKEIFVTAHDISTEWHIRIQSAFQKYTDNAVSKTINFSSDAMPEDIKRAYLSAYHQGCKGITVYRYGSRDRQVLNIEPAGNGTEKIAPRPRPARTHGVTERISTGCGKLYVTTNYDGKGMCEVFAQMGKTGGCASSQIEAAGRLISLALRSGVQVEAIIKQITGIRCPSPAWQDGKMVLSCPDAIARVLKNLLGYNFVEKSHMMGICPECDGILARMEGCLICHACGFSKCS